MKSPFALAPAPWQQWMGAFVVEVSVRPCELPLAFDAFSQTYQAPPRQEGKFVMDQSWFESCTTREKPCQLAVYKVKMGSVKSSDVFFVRPPQKDQALYWRRSLSEIAISIFSHFYVLLWLCSGSSPPFLTRTHGKQEAGTRNSTTSRDVGCKATCRGTATIFRLKMLKQHTLFEMCGIRWFGLALGSTDQGGWQRKLTFQLAWTTATLSILVYI